MWSKFKRALYPENKTYLKFRKFSDYFSQQKIAGYVGWIGKKNLGDKALWLACKKLFPELQILNYTRHFNPSKLDLLLYQKAFRKRSLYDLVLLGGGTLIGMPTYLDKIKDALRQNIPVAVFGSGVQNIDFWLNTYGPSFFKGPLTGDEKQFKKWINKATEEFPEWIETLKKAAYIFVRGPQSADILEAHGIKNIKIIGDPALSLYTPKNTDFEKKGKIGINIAGEYPTWGNSQKQVCKAIAEIINYLTKSGHEIELLPMNPDDLKFSREVIKDFNIGNISIWNKYDKVHATMDHIKTFDLVIGQRLHSLVLACGCAVPSIALEYRPKCLDFMKSIEKSNFCIKPEQITSEGIIDLVKHIYAEYGKICGELTDICDRYRSIQQEEAKKISKLIV